MGTIMLKKARKGEAPSISADSTRLSGSPLMNWEASRTDMGIPKAVYTRIIPVLVSVSPIFVSIRKRGIITEFVLMR